LAKTTVSAHSIMTGYNKLLSPQV